MFSETLEGQMTIFDFIDDPNEEQKKNESKVKEIEIREILRGSGFENGKERIYKFFNEYHTEKEQVDFLKKEYGIGGWTCEDGFCDHDANGIDIKFDPPIGKTLSVHIGWLMVARRIKELISGGLYKPKETPICKISNHVCNKEELWKVADTLDEIICPHMCCNMCSEKMCGARCNGTEEPKEKPKCSMAEECEAYTFGCGGTIEPCRFGGPYKWSK